jgi:hypothetical protein
MFNGKLSISTFNLILANKPVFKDGMEPKRQLCMHELTRKIADQIFW